MNNIETQNNYKEGEHYIKDNDYHNLYLYMQQHNNVNTFGKNKNSLLMMMIKNGKYKYTADLLRNNIENCNILHINNKGYNALTYACKLGKEKIAQCILNNAIDEERFILVNMITNKKETLLYICMKHLVSVNQHMLETTNYKNGNNIITTVCKKNMNNVACYLLNNNSDIISINKKNNKGYTAFYYACEQNMFDVVYLMLTKYKCDILNLHFDINGKNILNYIESEAIAHNKYKYIGNVWFSCWLTFYYSFWISVF
jgi:ankyrin repeat protein